LPAAQQFVRDHALEERVTLHGAQPHDMVKQLLHQADVFLQHSITDPKTGDEEGLPVAILEAMAQSVPVVATRHAGIPEAVHEGVTGYLVEEGDTQGMAERLAALANDPDRRWSLAEAAWQRVKQHFSWDRERAHLLKVLGLHASRCPERCAKLS
jgi:colanic acid/amylovoran biosynthesis glycosyltransferase